MASSGTDNLGEKSWDALQDAVERFEHDCASSFPRPLTPYLPAEDAKIRPYVLLELVRTDLELRWRRGQGVEVDFYLGQYQELKQPGTLLKLLEDEFKIRRRFGDKPTLEEYQRRYPHQYESLCMSLQGPEGGSTDSPEATLERAVGGVQHEDSLDSVFSMGGQFKKVRKIGEGAFGEVWQAEAPGGVPIAIKRVFAAISPRALARERSALDLICSGKLRHPFLLQVFGWWVQDDKLHIAMEWADASLEDSLKAIRKEGKPGLGRDDLKQVMIDAADALDFLNHERNILHRDVKPANMLLMAGRLKFCDFGLSRMVERLAMASQGTMGAGTPLFMAPEIIQGQQSPHSDQYSLAATYYMLRTGRAIFTGKVAQIRQKHVVTDPEFDDDILSFAEKQVLLRALHKNPNSRYPNNTDFVNALLRAGDQSKTGQMAPTLPTVGMSSAIPRGSDSGLSSSRSSIMSREAAAAASSAAVAASPHMSNLRSRSQVPSQEWRPLRRTGAMAPVSVPSSPMRQPQQPERWDYVRWGLLLATAAGVGGGIALMLIRLLKGTMS